MSAVTAHARHFVVRCSSIIFSAPWNVINFVYVVQFRESDRLFDRVQQSTRVEFGCTHRNLVSSPTSASTKR
jgi:hypothetical protein